MMIMVMMVCSGILDSRRNGAADGPVSNWAKDFFQLQWWLLLLL